MALVIAAWVLEVWEASAGVAWFDSGDTDVFLLMFQNIQSTGWWSTSDVIGGGGTDLSHYPLGGGALGHVLAIRALGLLVRDPNTLYNTYFLLSFPLVTIAAYYAVRRLALQPRFAFVISVLYGLLPYHFNRGERGHIFLAAYAAVPLAAMLIVRHASGEAILVRGGATGVVRSDRRAHVVEAVAIAVLIGSSTMYYALMFALLLVLVSLIASIRAGSDIVFTSAIRTAFLSGVVLLIGLAPTLWTWVSEGLLGSISRAYASTEVFSFKIISAILPIEDHRIPLFADFRERIADAPIPGEGPEAFGLAGVIGSVLLLWFIVARTLGTDHPLRQTPMAGALATSGLLALLLSTTAGLGALLPVLGITFLRSWARMGVFLAFFVLVALGLWLQTRTQHAGWSTRKVSVVLVALLVLGVLDQTSPAMAPDHAALQASHQQDVEYARDLEETLGQDARVLQLPYMTFPENGEPVRLGFYDHLRWPLTGSSLTWSFGTRRDGPSDWQRTVQSLDARGIAASAIATDHDAVMVDRYAFDSSADQLVSAMTELAGQPMTTAAGRFATFDVRDAVDLRPGARERLRDLVVNATTRGIGAGFLETTGAIGQPFTAGEEARILVDRGLDLRGGNRSISFTVTSREGPLQLTISTPHEERVLDVAGSPQRVELALPPTDREEEFIIDFQARSLSDYAGIPPSWQLTEITMPLGEAIDDLLGSS